MIKDILIGDMRKDAHAAPGAAVFHLLRGKNVHVLLLHSRGQDAGCLTPLHVCDCRSQTLNESMSGSIPGI